MNKKFAASKFCSPFFFITTSLLNKKMSLIIDVQQ